MKVRFGFLALVIGSSALLGSCKKEETAAPVEPAQAPEQKGDMAAPVADKQAPAFVAAIMKPYDDCRALLAADKTEGIADCAKAVSAAAKTAAGDANALAKEQLTSIATTADSLAAAGANEIEKIRLLYGDVSKSVVAMLSEIPEAAKDFHVFECPMAKGYQRWAQPEKTMANPYMGKKMLECGMEVHDHHEAGDNK